MGKLHSIKAAEPMLALVTATVGILAAMIGIWAASLSDYRTDIDKRMADAFVFLNHVIELAEENGRRKAETTSEDEAASKADTKLRELERSYYLSEPGLPPGKWSSLKYA